MANEKLKVAKVYCTGERERERGREGGREREGGKRQRERIYQVFFLQSTKPKKKAKATLGAAGKVARRADYDDYEDGGLGAEFDDFM